MAVLAAFPFADEADPGDAGAEAADSGAVGADAGARRALAALAQLPDPAERARAYAGKSKSDATIRAYAAGWRDFVSFCEQRGASALPADDQTVAAYPADMADRGAKAATIARRLVVISQAHKAADLTSPRHRHWSAAPTPVSAAHWGRPNWARHPHWWTISSACSTTCPIRASV